MRTLITITKSATRYIASAHGKFGGGYTNATAGSTTHEAAAFAANAMCQYATSNPDGGDLIAPPEVLALVPKRLHSI